METSTPQMLTSTQIVDLMFLVRLSVRSRMALSCNDSKDQDKYDLVRIDNNCFAFLYLDHSYSEALSFCQDVGGHLTDIDSVTERHLEKFSAKRNTTKKEFWIGLVYMKALARWLWVNGAKFSFKSQFEEDYFGACILWDIDSKKWEYTDCSRRKPFICKRAMILHTPKCKDDEDKNSLTETNLVTPHTTTFQLTNATQYLTTIPLTNATEYLTQGSTITICDIQGFIKMMTLLAILSISALANLIFLVTCCCRCHKRSKQRKKRHSQFPLNDMVIPSTTGHRIVTDPPSTRSNALVKATEPGPIPHSDHSDQTYEIPANAVDLTSTRSNAMVNASKPGATPYSDHSDHTYEIPVAAVDSGREINSSRTDYDRLTMVYSNEEGLYAMPEF